MGTPSGRGTLRVDLDRIGQQLHLDALPRLCPRHRSVVRGGTPPRHYSASLEQKIGRIATVLGQ